jgi:peptidyl-prolyl cis-trans isomerase C
MMRSSRVIIFLAAAVLCSGLAAGCGRAKQNDNAVLARVSNRSITLASFKSRINRLPAYYQSIIKNNLKRYLDETIMEMLLYEEALRNRLDRDKEIRSVIEEAKKKILISKVVADEVDNKAKVSIEEARRYYDDHKDEFKSPEMWRASHILVSDEPQAKLIMEELSKGADFAELAKTRSTDATASRGGDIGFFRQGQLVPEFEKACLKLKVGETGEILHTQFGYHIIKLTDKREAASLRFDEAKRSIEAELIRKKKAVLFDEMVAKLKERYSVSINNEVLGAYEASEKTKKEAVK